MPVETVAYQQVPRGAHRTGLSGCIDQTSTLTSDASATSEQALAPGGSAPAGSSNDTWQWSLRKLSSRSYQVCAGNTGWGKKTLRSKLTFATSDRKKPSRGCGQPAGE